MKKLLKTPEAAEYLGIEPGTLENWRYKGMGPAFVHLGRSVRYEVTALDAWVEAQKAA